MFKPINKYIVIKKINEEVETESGLLLSSKDVSDMRYAKADVVKVGTNVDTVLDGQIIYFDKSAGHTLLINNEPYTIIKEADVVVVL